MLLQAMLLIRRKEFVAFDWEAVTAGYTRNLPHITQPGVIYFITFRLADAVPVEIAARWKRERDEWLFEHPRPWSAETETEFRRRFTARMERWMDAGHGSCVLRQPELREEVRRCLLHDDPLQYDLGDFVIMPNHVHLLLRPRSAVQLKNLLRPIKGVSARNINTATGNSGALWQGESFDHIVRSLEQLQRLQRYIRDNPVKAGLKREEFTHERRWQVEE